MTLSDFHLAILNYLNKLPVGEARTTEEIGKGIPLALIGGNLPRVQWEYRRGMWIANRGGPLCSRLARQGYLVKVPNGNHSKWKLGPRSDELKEQGVLP